MSKRLIVKSIVSMAQSEGNGARVRRSIGSAKLHNFDPFLLLDEFYVDPPAGFPDHPHRGFETVTYMLKGKFKHEDFAGHKGSIGPGDLQWMTAGRGIVHAEMPASRETSHGLQLWVNLPGKDKLCEPAYQEMLDAEVPRAVVEGAEVKIIAGEAFGVDAKVVTRTPIIYLDVKLQPGKSLEHAVKDTYNGFVYVLEGSGTFGANQKHSDAHTTLVMGNGSALDVQAGDQGLHYVLIAGEPIGEPVVQYGPFVMTTNEEIMQAMRDYQTNSNGFERARTFQSSIYHGAI
jgi:hypothetical protein